MKRAIVFLNKTPSDKLVNIILSIQSTCTKLEDYDFFLTTDTPGCIVNVPSIQHIFYEDKMMRAEGFQGTLLPWHISKPSAWEKSLYYFTRISNNYKDVWFIEDDVFVPSMNPIEKADEIEADLLCANSIYFKEEPFEKWHWHLARNKMDFPWGRSMMCACRLSQKLLGLIGDWVTNNNELLYHEFFFPTLCLHNELKIVTPDCLQSITYRYPWSDNEILADGLYHPIKDLDRHSFLHRILLGQNLKA